MFLVSKYASVRVDRSVSVRVCATCECASVLYGDGDERRVMDCAKMSQLQHRQRDIIKQGSVQSCLLCTVAVL